MTEVKKLRPPTSELVALLREAREQERDEIREVVEGVENPYSPRDCDFIVFEEARDAIKKAIEEKE